ncbi:hypothetical protein [Ethanoligenens harbinense]|uniref:hypothetical protein n=1 Tax=Ethanoligenens harbinense TaxID=253239 RepID=UPI0010C072F2|nr:hypothetical protein [Ethanoligenens harbinense]
MPSAANISEDHELRSKFVWGLINDKDNFSPQCADQNIPHVLFQFWNDSESIPLDVQECIESWHPLEEQGFKRLLFDDITANNFIKNHFGNRYLNAFHRCLHPAMRSDYFRLCYLVKMADSMSTQMMFIGIFLLKNYSSIVG